MKVSGSILAVKDDYLNYAKKLKQARVDCLHVDVFQNNVSFQLEQLLQFDERYLPLDVHMIFEEISSREIDILNKSRTMYLSVQYENLHNKECIHHLSKKFNGRFGISITAETPIDIIDEYIGDISHVLFMCSQPGISGAKFEDSNFKRIAMVHNKYPMLSLYADGGINKEIAERMARLGISMVVSGSFLCKDMEKLGKKAYSLKYSGEKDVEVTRNMVPLKELPIVDSNSPFMTIVDIMTKYRMGIVFVISGDDFQGVITDGDIRRGFLRYGKDIFDIRAIQLSNSDSFVAQANTTMEELINFLYGLQKGIEVVPIVENNKVIGAIDLRMGY